MRFQTLMLLVFTGTGAGVAGFIIGRGHSLLKGERIVAAFLACVVGAMIFAITSPAMLPALAIPISVYIVLAIEGCVKPLGMHFFDCTLWLSNRFPCAATYWLHRTLNLSFPVFANWPKPSASEDP